MIMQTTIWLNQSIRSPWPYTGIFDEAWSAYERVLLRYTIHPPARTLALEKKQVRLVLEKILESQISSSDETKSVELLPVLEIENSALQYIPVVRKYQKTTAAKRAAHKFVVERSIHFWPAGE